MGRIVDFPAFISRYPFKPDITDREWKFTLTDPIMECNQGTFLLEISRDGHGEVTRISEKCEDVISIQTMTTMLMGYKDRTIWLKSAGITGERSCNRYAGRCN